MRDEGGILPGPAADGLHPIRTRLHGIEEAPLADRASGFTAVHDELLRELESGDSPRDA